VTAVVAGCTATDVPSTSCVTAHAPTHASSPNEETLASALPAEPSLRWTVFNNVLGLDLTVEAGTLKQLEDRIKTQTSPTKGQSPLLKLATFNGQRNAKGVLRYDEAVVDIHGIECDYDGGKMTLLEAADLLEKAGLHAVLHTTPSCTPDNHRWRALLPTSGPLPPDRRSHLLDRANGVLGGVLARESWTLSQPYHFGRVAINEHFQSARTKCGAAAVCVDQAHYLDARRIGPSRAKSDGTKPRSIGLFTEAISANDGALLSTGTGRRSLMFSYAAGLSADGLLPEQLRALVQDAAERYFDPADPPKDGFVDEVVEHFSRKGEGLQPFDNQLPGALGAHVVEATPRKKLFSSLGEMTGRMTSTQWLVDGHIERVGLVLLFGPSGGGKSMLAIDVAMCVATGRPWWGNKVEQGAVFVIAGEGHSGYSKRMNAWCKKNKADPMSLPVYVSDRAVSMTDLTQLQQIVDEITELVASGVKVRLIEIDTLARNIGEGDENAAKDVGLFVEACDALKRKFDCTVAVVHHTGHDSERARGSSALRAAVDQEFHVKPVGGLDSKAFTFTCTKMKEADQPKPMEFEIKEHGTGRYFDHPDGDQEEIVSAVLGLKSDPFAFDLAPGVSASRVLERMHQDWPGTTAFSVEVGAKNERDVRRWLSVLVEKGWVQKDGSHKHTKYSLTEAALLELEGGRGGLLKTHEQHARAAAEGV